MHWVVQTNIHREAGHDVLMKAIQKRNLPYDLVKVIPYVHQLKTDINPPNPCIAIGANTLSLISQNKGWKPGVYINNNFDYETYIKKWNSHMLNDESIITTWGDILKLNKENSDLEIFIRPCNDGKTFSGEITSWKNLKRWKDKVEQMRIVFSLGKSEAIPDDIKILIAPLQKIYKEYRFFVVNGVVVTGSLYKEGTRVYSKPCIDKPVIKFAQDMVNIWQPDKAFVLDVADTINGLQIIEINSLNSAGFYACDMDKVVQALEDMVNNVY